MRLSLVLVAGAVLAACGSTPSTDGGSDGGSGSDGGGGSDGGLTAAAFCERYPTALCSVKVACGTYSDAGFAACVDTERRAIQDTCFRVSAGTVLFHPEAAEACLEETSLSPPACILATGWGCGLDYGYADSVDRIFSVVLNGCGAAACGAGTACDNDCADPQCRPLRAIGQTCDYERQSSRCVPEGFCAPEDGGVGAPSVCHLLYTETECPQGVCGPGHYCAGTTCFPHKTRDMPCGARSECEDEVCRSTDGRCGALDAGARCLNPEDCGNWDAPNFCIGLTLSSDGGVADAGVCGPRPTVGEPCSPDWGSRSYACGFEKPEACLDGRCRRLGHFTDPVGSECQLRPWGITADRYYGFASCAPGLGCMPAADAHPPSIGRCVPLLAEGALCTSASECDLSLICDSRDGGPPTCLPRAGLHESCGICLGELTCVDTSPGTRWCVPPVANGESCQPNATCANGYCNRPVPVCTAYASACTEGFQCESGRCNAGQCAAPGTCLSAY